MNVTSFKDVVSHFGSQDKTANALEVKQPTICHAVSTNQVSADMAMRVQRKTNGKFKASDLRPSLKEFAGMVIL